MSSKLVYPESSWEFKTNINKLKKTKYLSPFFLLGLGYLQKFFVIQFNEVKHILLFYFNVFTIKCIERSLKS